MNRQEAELLVAPHIFNVEQYQSVSRNDVLEMLGEELYGNKLLRDPIRNLGPTRETIYPWNVIDYLQIKG
jgi:hypothetical protein